MWQLVKDFFTVKSFAVRVLRVLIVTAGTGMATGQIPIAEEWQWVGWVVATIGAAISQQPEPEE